MNEWIIQWILFISSDVVLSVSPSEHCHICCKSPVNSWIISQGALQPLWQIKEKSSTRKAVWFERRPAASALEGGVKEPRVTWAMLLSTGAEGFGCSSRNDPGWRRPMTSAGLVTWRQFAVSSRLETTGTSRTSCPHCCKRGLLPRLPMGYEFSVFENTHWVTDTKIKMLTHFYSNMEKLEINMEIF